MTDEGAPRPAKAGRWLWDFHQDVKAIWASGLSTMERALVQAYRLHVNTKTGKAWPGCGALQDMSGLSRASVMRTRARLIDLGVIVVDSSPPGKVLVVTLDLSKLPDLSHREAGITERRVSEGDTTGIRGRWVGVSEGGGHQSHRDTRTGEREQERENGNEEHIGVVPEPEPEPEMPPHLDGIKLGAKVDPVEVTPAMAEVFVEWRERQACPAVARLSAPRARYLAKVTADYSVAELVAVIEYAWDAPQSAPLVDYWRNNTAMNLEMLMRDEHITRNVEAAARWKANALPVNINDPKVILF